MSRTFDIKNSDFNKSRVVQLHQELPLMTISHKKLVKRFLYKQDYYYDWIHALLISNTFVITTPCWNCQKVKQKLSNTLRLNFCQPSPKNKLMRLFQWDYCVNEIIWLIVINRKKQITKIRHE